MQIWSTNSGWFQIFRYGEEQFTNIQNKKCLDVHGGKDEEGRKVIVWNKHNGANQRWTVVYVDTVKAQTKGLNKDFGFHVNRPFYIRSRLVMKRVVQCHGASTIKLNRYVKTTVAQQWYFDAVSKTVRSNHWKNYAMQIPGNGGQNELSMTSGINSRWW